MEYRDYYKIMGVARDATQDEIKKTYRKLARKYHPDVSKEKNAEDKFKEVQEAYNVLGDVKKRAAYDQLGANWKQGEQFRPPPDWGRNYEFSTQFEDDNGGYSDFFANLFGGSSPFSRGGGTGPFTRSSGGGRAPGRDHRASIDITLEEAYRGGTRNLQLQRPAVTANGRVELKNHELKVTIPPGVTDSQQIRLSGQGEAGRSPQSKAGDLYLEVHVKPHPLYKLDGRDVTLELPVTPWELALGATVEVPTLGGPVQLQIPAGARPGQKMRLRGRGLPGNPPGDQYVVLKVVLPPANNKRAQALYEQMKQDLDFDPRADFHRTS